jgi:2-pyrone-4,6-dicarboxylate lactonase
MTNSPNPAAPPCAAPFAPTGRPRLSVPALACDTHAHILGPAADFPYIEERVYTPPDCLLAHYQAMLQALGMTRCVLVQPSVYGSDNRVMLAALRQLGPDMARGVAVVDADIDPAQLVAMHALGVRGVRVNLVDRREKSGGLPMQDLSMLAERIAGLGWHLELLVHVNEIAGFEDPLGALPVPVVFGHLGYAPAALGVQDAGFQSLLRMAQAGRAWVKLTGPYRLSAQALPYAAVLPFARELAQRCPQQLLWGSDWPHVMLKGVMPDDASLLDLLADWLPDPVVRQQVLVDNPARLYGWA